MLSALRGAFGWVAGKITRQGAQNMAIKTAAAQAQKVPMKVLDHGADGEGYGARGYRIMGFKRELVLGIALGVAVSFIIPGSGLIVQGLAAGWATNVVAAGVGVVAGEPVESKPAAAVDEVESEPSSGDGPGVTGQVGSNEPTVQSNVPPDEGPVVYGPGTGDTGGGGDVHTGNETSTSSSSTSDNDTDHEDPHEEP